MYIHPYIPCRRSSSSDSHLPSRYPENLLYYVDRALFSHTYLRMRNHRKVESCQKEKGVVKLRSKRHGCERGSDYTGLYICTYVHTYCVRATRCRNVGRSVKVGLSGFAFVLTNNEPSQGLVVV